MEELANNPSITMNSVIEKESYLSNSYLNELLKTERDLRARAESTIENELDIVLKSQGLKSWLGVVFPPVDITFDDTPKVLVISPRDQIKLQETVLLNSDIDKICIENPVPSLKAGLPKYDQIIQPYQFGHDHSKKTCLWLKNLPKLQPTKMSKLLLSLSLSLQ